MKCIVLSILLGLSMGAAADADQPMDTSEIIQLLNRLCSQTGTGWLERGQIEAIHRSSDFISGQTVETYETVVTDGNRFFWNIRILDDDDHAGEKKSGNAQFRKWNQDRTFVWDGQTYTLYFKPGNRAVVYEDASSIPINVTGPLKAGYIPWGGGIFTYESLSNAVFSASVLQTQDGPGIQLSVQPNDRIRMQFLLDPAKGDAVLSYTLFIGEVSKTVHTYGNFIEQQGRFIPTNILIDRYKDNQLEASDSWEIVSLQDTLPQQNPFAVALQEKALVEYHERDLEKPMFYRHSKKRNIDTLRQKRCVAALKKEVQKQNCATVAVEEALSGFGVSVTDAELATLVRNDTGDTTLYQIQHLLEQKGLFAMPVKTTLAGLQRYKDARILLHFPKKQHFALLDYIDQKNVWVVDLDRQTFYHCMNMTRFDKEWAGIALVISNSTLSLGSNDKSLPEVVLRNVTGSADYSCSELIQGYAVDSCPDMVGSTCGGRYTKWDNVYACEVNNSDGYCEGTGVVGHVYSPCIVDSDDLTQCAVQGDYTVVYIRGCLP